jgi:2-oxoglutarate dehydrogenase E1 component
MEVSFPWNAEYIDAQYQLWKSDPRKVAREWQLFFEGFELSTSPERATGICDKSQILVQSHVEELIYRYRDIGHLLSCLDPLSSCPVDHPLLSLGAFGLDESYLDRTFYTPHFPGSEHMTLREILSVLKETYCRTIGVEYMHLQDPEERKWLQVRMEPVRNRPSLKKASKLRILNKLCQATLFEQLLHSRYLGQKRFSLEGAETTVAMLDTLALHAAEAGCREIILGMAHRGRLNVQVNVLEKPFEAVFCEFEESYNPEDLVGSGDVKYHTGYMADVEIDDRHSLRILLSPNASHLESVNPVIEGIARARQEEVNDGDRSRVLPVLIHGDAAFSGQGVVFETLNLSQLDGFLTGGTIHIVINNQIGFTTLPEDLRSTRYSTDVAKMLMVPIFHVHAEDPEAAAHVTTLALDYRREFAKDVVIDLVCYRRYGHNEGDEPYYTQPEMYSRIKDRPAPYEIYSEKLMREGVAGAEEVDVIKKGIKECLAVAYKSAHEKTCAPPEDHFYEKWSGLEKAYSHAPVGTGVEEHTLLSIARKLNSFPDGFSINRKLKRILDRRIESVEKGEGIDWATAEALAFGALLLDGVPVRLCGQDTRRGTFSQRHGVLVDQENGRHFVPLEALDPKQAPFHAYDSMLSENAVLGFEYGYSLVSPDWLVMWEAQFGDFANNAQCIIDQYISCSEAKWRRYSGIVLLLPHGYEGQGAEHSSARLERYLQLCAEDAMEVCYPTTPAQYFHMLRRQVKRDFRRPLVVMTPKSLLRHPLAVSKLGELASGSFQELMDDPEPAERPRRVIFCSGKIYYDLLERRRSLERKDQVLLRLEQLYPFHRTRAEELATRYARAEEWVWVQEEPRNMGGWSFVRERLESITGKNFAYVGRPPASSPAAGHLGIHKREQSEILDRAFGPLSGNK